MSEGGQQIPLTRDLLGYLLEHSAPLPDQIGVALDRARELGHESMQISPDQAVLLRFLLRVIGARRVLEIGTFLGLSALVMADAVGPDGEVVCLDRNEDWAAEARGLWESAGVSDRIELIVGDAHSTVRTVTGFLDAVLIDADKTGYGDYLEAVTPLIRPGGLLIVDNTLWYGSVVDPDDDSADTQALRRFNTDLVSHSAYEVAMVAVGDGFTLAHRK